MLQIEYDHYFAGNAFFAIIPNNNLIVKYGLKQLYQYRICERNKFFYCSFIENNYFNFLGILDYHSSKIFLKFSNYCGRNEKELMVLEKLLCHSKEEDFILLKNSFTIQPLCCFCCGKLIINPNNVFGPDCEIKNYGRNPSRLDDSFS